MTKGQSRELHLNLNLLNAGTFTVSWRWLETNPSGIFDIEFFVKAAQFAERGTFDALFLADIPALSDQPEYRPFQSLEPTIVLTTVAAHTHHIGRIATAPPTYNEPYNIARRYASLDHASGGRSGLNVVTTADPVSARNFGFKERRSHAERYVRAAEFTEVVKALWDSREDDALVANKASGRFIDTSRVHPIRHHYKYYSVDGVLNVPRPPQGRPILVQAGAYLPAKRRACGEYRNYQAGATCRRQSLIRLGTLQPKQSSQGNVVARAGRLSGFAKNHARPKKYERSFVGLPGNVILAKGNPHDRAPA